MSHKKSENLIDLNQIHKGYLIIADISGYTKFLVQSELDHARAILSELSNLLIEKLSAPLRFVELEGDAVFTFAPDVSIEDSERLIDIIEVCYGAFRLRLKQMITNTTCTCKACSSIKNLDLKCVAHFGSYGLQKTPSHIKLVGPDVILIHRLLKNTVKEKTGIKAYTLVTQAFIEKATFKETSLGMHKHVDSYPELGDITCFVLNLEPAVQKFRDSVKYYLESKDADIEIITELPVPCSVAWSYHVDAKRRLRWQKDTLTINNKPSLDGRTGIGWESHCDHGGYKLVHRIIDWQPFDYISMETKSYGKSITKPPTCKATFDLKELPGNHCSVSMRLYTIKRDVFTIIIIRFLKHFIEKQWRNHYRELILLLNEDESMAEVAAGKIP